MSSKPILEATKKAFKGIQPETITLDNGSEFALFKDMEKELNTTVYFAHIRLGSVAATKTQMDYYVSFFQEVLILEHLLMKSYKRLLT